MIQVVNFLVDHLLVELWGILFLSIPNGNIYESFTRHS